MRFLRQNRKRIMHPLSVCFNSFVTVIYISSVTSLLLATSLYPASTSRSAQTGQTVPFTRALITDFHSLPHLLQCHHTFFLDFALTSSGFNGKFFSDHSEAISGCVVCKSLNPFRNMYPLQYGHLLPPERVEIRVFHSLPQSLHFHQALRLAKTVT